jgi:hypothetical protein
MDQYFSLNEHLATIFPRFALSFFFPVDAERVVNCSIAPVSPCNSIAVVTRT